MPHASDDTSPPQIPSQLIDEALARVLASRGFRASARKRRFLQFVVQQTLAGHADRIKAYTIAMDVFDRDASFDPLLDPVVRIQAGRIRHCLEQYYLTEGAGDPVEITIPKGSYVPHFIVRSPAVPAERAARAPMASSQGIADSTSGLPAGGVLRVAAHGSALGSVRRGVVAAAALLLVTVLLAATLWYAMGPGAGGVRSSEKDDRMIAMRGPSLLVLPFANGTGNPAQDMLAEGFTEDLIGALIRFRSVLVFGADTSFRFRSAPALHEAEPNTAIDYVLKGSVGQTGEQVQVTVALMNAKNRQYLWSDSYRRDMSHTAMIDLRQDITVQIARALAQSQGQSYAPAGRDEAAAVRARSPKELASYECMLRTRQYWRHLDADLHAQVRACLEQATRADPLYADAWAALAMVTIDEARLGFNPVDAHDDPVGIGLELAKHALVLAPDTPLPLQALGLAHWLRREPQLSIAAYEQALALNPNDSDILADLGRSYSLIGNWDKGIPLIREAYARNPAQPGWYRIVLALYHYMNGRYDDALAEAQRIDVPDSVLPHAALAMIHGQTGNRAEADREVREILRIDPKFADKAVAEFQRRNIAPPTIVRIVDGLRKAGLPVAQNLTSVDGD